MNRESLSIVSAIIKNIVRDGNMPYLSEYFTYQKEKIVKQLIDESGSLTQEDIIAANAKMLVYDDLTSFDKLVEEDIQ